MRTTAGMVRVLIEFVVLWLASAITLLVLDHLLDGVTLTSVDWGLSEFRTMPAALGIALVFGLLNTLLWPAVVRLMSWVGPVILFLGMFLAGGALLLLTIAIIPGATVHRTASVFVMAALLSLVSSVVAAAVASRSDTSYRLMQVRRHRFRRRSRHPNPPGTDQHPGLLCIQIDGLGHGVLRRAIADGVTPTLARLVRESHTLIPWHTDWSSQTGATQLGVLHGSNHDVPAFRWYDKESGAIAVFSNPRSNEIREAERAEIPGLLAVDGASRGNLFTGGATDNVLVVSRMRGARLGGGAGYVAYFIDPSSALRTVIGMIAEIVRELRQSLHQRRKDIQPRVPRGGIYPFVRAFTTVLATDMTTAAVVGDLIAGRSIIYLDLIGYDEVSHHSGVSRPETLAVLTKVDETVDLLLGAAGHADRDYRVVLLSDHGQSQGATFRQRYGESLGELVTRLVGENGTRAGGARRSKDDSEGRLYVAASVGQAETGPDAEADQATGTPVVLGSGNLGLVSFPDLPGRATLTDIEDRHPGFLDTLRTHPGIGFLLVARTDGGSVVLGPSGSVDVATGEVTGDDPLALFGDDALDKVRRTDGFTNVADIMVSSAYWPETDEIAAFEEQVGSHGGMGGPQSTPFLLYPADLPAPPSPLRGAEAVHTVLAGWRDCRR